jgi:hypothetical protein
MDYNAIWEIIKSKVDKATLYYADTLSNKNIHMLVTTAVDNGVYSAAVELESWADDELEKLNS